MNRKEYNNRLDAPLVNPGFTMSEYEETQGRVESCYCGCNSEHEFTTACIPF